MLKTGDPLFSGDRITAPSESLLIVLLNAKALVTVREFSVFSIAGIEKSDIVLDAGKIRFNLRKEKLRSAETYEIHTPNAIVQVRGGSCVVEVLRSVTTIDSANGDCSGGLAVGPLVQIPPGQGMTITGEVLGPLRPARPHVQSGLGPQSKD